MNNYDISFNAPCSICGVDCHQGKTVQATNPRKAWEQVPDGATYVDVIEELPSGAQINWNPDGTVRETWVPGSAGWVRGIPR
jgi:uncharacterized Fe-S cluster protein YjdI